MLSVSFSTENMKRELGYLDLDLLMNNGFLHNRLMTNNENYSSIRELSVSDIPKNR
jgi:hypothetical protein